MSVSKILKSITIFSLTMITIISSLVPAFAVEGEDIDSSQNGEVIESTYLSTPVLKNPKNTEKGVEVLWEKVSGAKGYKVFVKKNDVWEELGVSLTNSFIDENVESGEIYTYTVCCVDEDGVSQTSLFDETGKSIKFMEVPEIKSFNNVAGGTEIKWNKVSGATKYYIYRQVEGKWKYTGSSKTTKYLHKITQNNSSYIYSIRSEDETGVYKSGYDSTGASNTFLSAPVLTKTKNTVNGIRIYWNKVEGASKYKVFVKDGSSWKAIGTTKSTSFTHTDVTSGKRYKYTVRCVSSNGKTNTSYFDNKGISHIYLSAPKNIKFNNTDTGAEITWGKVTGATKYKIYIKNGTAWKYLSSTSKTTYLHKISATRAKHTYKIVATNVNSGYSSGFYADGFSNLFVAPPAFSSVTYKNGGYLLKWNAISGVSKYRVYRKTTTSSWKKIADVEGAQFLDKTAKKTGVYMYTLRCLDESSKIISSYRKDNPYYTNGKLLGNRIIKIGNGSYSYVGADGVICETKEIQLAVDFLMKHGKGDTPEEKLKTGFMYMARNYPYNRSYDHPKKASDLGPLAIDIFQNKKGNCFRQAAALACMARASGYRARVVVGETISSASGLFVPHGWTEIYVDGEWLICDMNAQMRHADLRYYMLDYHYWTIKPMHRYEIVVSGGKATWK